MSIMTKTGDGGMTSLYCGGRVAKDNIRIEACGTLDEVSSFLGLAKSVAKDKKTRRIVCSVQKELVTLNAEIATTISSAKKLKNRIAKDSVCALEKEILCLEKSQAIKLRSFCIPGENMASSTLDIARAITRRAERRCFTMIKKSMITNGNITTYLNRLSDLLWLLARLNEKKK